MKPFQFRLQRVLSWRGTLLSLAEAKLEQLNSGLRTTEKAISDLLERRTAEQQRVAGNALLSGAELRELESSRVWTVREDKRLSSLRMEQRRSVEAQTRCAAEARRGLKLVERLKERRYNTWRAEADQELDALSAESAISQWRRSGQNDVFLD